MKFIEIKSKINWGFWVLGKPWFVIKQYYAMKADHISFDGSVPLDIGLVEMDENYVQQCDGMGDYKVKRFYQEDHDNGFRGYVVLLDGNIIGFICGAKVDLSEWKCKVEDDYFYIKYVYVDHKFRGQHIARLLLKQTESIPGGGMLYLMVRKNNVSAIRSYEKSGFQKLFYRKQIVFPLLHKKINYYYRFYDLK